MNNLPILIRRQIEAMILKNVYDVLLEKYSKEEADDIIGSAVSQSAIAHGKAFAKELGHTPVLQDMIDIMPNWTKEDALKIEMLPSDEKNLNYNITRCRYAEMYKQMGVGDIGHLLSCNRDGDFCIGFNPNMKLDRTQTIMQGADYCDFRYHMEDDV